MTLDLSTKYLTTASWLKEIIIFKSYCATYYLLSDTKTTRLPKYIQHYLKIFWLIYVHVISCMRKPLCVHIACTLVTVRAICRALSKAPKIYLRWSSLLLTANYCPKQLHYHRCLWQSWIAHWKLYRKIETFLTVLNEDNTDALTHYLQTLNLDITEHIRILKSYDYFLLLTWYKHSVTGIL